MRFVVLIPARLASTRLPRKALADIGGVPMIVRTARRAAASHASRVVVAADDDAPNLIRLFDFGIINQRLEPAPGEIRNA